MTKFQRMLDVLVLIINSMGLLLFSLMHNYFGLVWAGFFVVYSSTRLLEGDKHEAEE